MRHRLRMATVGLATAVVIVLVVLALLNRLPMPLQKIQRALGPWYTQPPLNAKYLFRLVVQNFNAKGEIEVVKTLTPEDIFLNRINHDLLTNRQYQYWRNPASFAVLYVGAIEVFTMKTPLQPQSTSADHVGPNDYQRWPRSFNVNRSSLNLVQTLWLSDVTYNSRLRDPQFDAPVADFMTLYKPGPSVVGMDYKALQAQLARITKKPCVARDTNMSDQEYGEALQASYNEYYAQQSSAWLANQKSPFNADDAATFPRSLEFVPA